MEQNCPICAVEDGCDHLLASFALGDDAEGEFGIGLVSGMLIEMNGLHSLFELVRSAWAKPMLESGKAEMPKWVRQRPELHAYWDALGTAAVDPEAYGGAEDFLSDVQADLSQRANCCELSSVN